MFIGPIIILFLLLLNVSVFYLNGEGCCVLGPRLPLRRALERLTIGLRTTGRVGGIKPSSKVESVVILRYLQTRSVTTEPSTEIEKSSSYRERSKQMTRNKEMGRERNASIMHTSLQGQQEIYC